MSIADFADGAPAVKLLNKFPIIEIISFTIPITPLNASPRLVIAPVFFNLDKNSVTSPEAFIKNLDTL